MAALTAADIGLAGAVVTAAVAFWAVYMALYVFVFSHFQASSDKERLTGGKDVYGFFAEGSALSVFSFATVALTFTALWIDQEWPLALAVFVFMPEFIIGTILIIKQASRVGRTALPYALVEYVVRGKLEEFEAKVGKRLTRAQRTRLVRGLLQDEEVAVGLLKVTEKVVAEVDAGVPKKSDWWRRKRKRPASNGEPKPSADEKNSNGKDGDEGSPKAKP